MAEYVDALQRQERYEEIINLAGFLERPLRQQPIYEFDKYSEGEFLQRYRFTKRTTAELIHELSPSLEPSRADGISPHLQVLAALRFFAVGECNFNVFAQSFSMQNVTPR